MRYAKATVEEQEERQDIYAHHVAEAALAAATAATAAAAAAATAAAAAAEAPLDAPSPAGDADVRQPSV